MQHARLAKNRCCLSSRIDTTLIPYNDQGDRLHSTNDWLLCMNATGLSALHSQPRAQRHYRCSLQANTVTQLSGW